MEETPTQRTVRLLQEDARKSMFTEFQRNLLRDLVTEEIKAVKSGSTVYGDADMQTEVLTELEEISAKLS